MPPLEHVIVAGIVLGIFSATIDTIFSYYFR